MQRGGRLGAQKRSPKIKNNVAGIQANTGRGTGREESKERKVGSGKNGELGLRESPVNTAPSGMPNSLPSIKRGKKKRSPTSMNRKLRLQPGKIRTRGGGLESRGDC